MTRRHSFFHPSSFIPHPFLTQMATIYVPAQLRELTGGVDRFEVSGGTLRQVLAELAVHQPRLVERLSSGDALTTGLAVSIDGAFSSRGLSAKVGPDSEVHFLPAIGGG
jgi:sulfur-carrier protein